MAHLRSLAQGGGTQERIGRLEETVREQGAAGDRREQRTRSTLAALENKLAALERDVHERLTSVMQRVGSAGFRSERPSSGRSGKEMFRMLSTDAETIGDESTSLHRSSSATPSAESIEELMERFMTLEKESRQQGVSLKDTVDQRIKPLEAEMKHQRLSCQVLADELREERLTRGKVENRVTGLEASVTPLTQALEAEQRATAARVIRTMRFKAAEDHLDNFTPGPESPGPTVHRPVSKGSKSEERLQPHFPSGRSERSAASNNRVCFWDK